MPNSISRANLNFLLISLATLCFVPLSACKEKETPSHHSNFQQDHEVRIASYSPDDRKIILKHLGEALKGSESRSSNYEKAILILQYLHKNIKMKASDNHRTGVDVLQSGYAACGGFAMAMAEMLDELSIKNHYAYFIGGAFAHSMVEAVFSEDTRGLFDPTYGVYYFDKHTNRPVSILELERYVKDQKNPVVYLNERQTEAVEQYNFPKIYADASSAGLANSGFVETPTISLFPNKPVGAYDWAFTEHEPLPWKRLARHKASNGRFISWLYMLGQSGLGYNIQHFYQIKNVHPKKEYTLTLKISSARGNNGLPAALTVTFVGSSKKPFKHYILEKKFNAKTYEPYILEIPLPQLEANAGMLLQVDGYLVIQAIRLSDGSYGKTNIE